MAVRQIEISGMPIGIEGLDEILEEVKGLGLKEEKELKKVLLEKVERRNYIPSNRKELYAQALYEEYLVYIGIIKERPKRRAFPEIKVYGMGCPNCKLLNQMVMKTLAETGLMADYRYVTELAEITADGIVITPALTVNGKLVFKGIPSSQKEIEEIIIKAIKEQEK